MISAVIPAAGLGTRSLPASKAIPKEMLPIFDRPIIQYIAEEALNSDIKSLIFVNSKGKEAIENHFDIQKDLEEALRKSKKMDLLDSISQLSRAFRVQSVRQKEPLGLGHAVLCAEHLIADSHFMVMLGDDMIESPVPGARQLLNTFDRLRPPHSVKKEDCGVVLLKQVTESEVSKYGICDLESEVNGARILRCVEKPKPDQVKSRRGIVGRYFLPRTIFSILSNQNTGALGEIQLTDALNTLAESGKLYACLLDGQRFDAGDRMGYLEANLYYYLKSSYGDEVRSMLRNIISGQS